MRLNTDLNFMPDLIKLSQESSRNSGNVPADTLFLEGSPIHGMTAFFIALPTEQGTDDAEIEVPNPYAATVIRQRGTGRNSGKVTFNGFPHGMAARRILLYIFATAYRKGLVSVIPLFAPSRNETLRQWGYNFGRSPTGNHPAFEQVERLYGCIYEFTKKFRNTESGLTDARYFRNRLLLKADEMPITSLTRKLHALEKLKNTQGNFYVHPLFGFTLKFPVDMKHVLKLRKKSSFWNVYMFLIDALPHIEKGKTKRIPWEWMHDIFLRRYNTTANFKLNFTQLCDEVFEIYPQARGRIDTSRSDVLILKHAEPPI